MITPLQTEVIRIAAVLARGQLAVNPDILQTIMRQASQQLKDAVTKERADVEEN